LAGHRPIENSCHHTYATLSPHSMSQLTAQQKHDILVHCETRRAGESEVEVAAQHGARVSRQTIWRWRQRWDHTPSSLRHAPVPGRPRLLTPAEVSRHVRAPILAANRSHRQVSYTKLLPEVHRKAGKPISIRTLRRIGKEQLGAKAKRTTKRTRQECQYTHTSGDAPARMCQACD
jgi:transposase